MILFFDTETTGFPSKKVPYGDDSQPHVVELAAELTDDYGNPVAAFHSIIDPGVSNGIRIPDKVVEIHGIDEEKCWRLGGDPQLAAMHFARMLECADLVVAHHVEFDLQMMLILYARTYADAAYPEWPRKYCTMAGARNVIGGGNPSLSACAKHFFHIEHVRAHSALWDMRACKDIYFHLRALEKGEPAPTQGAPKSVWD